MVHNYFTLGHGKGEHDGARAIIKRALTHYRAYYSEDHPEMLLVLYELAAIFFYQGLNGRSEKLLREILTRWKEVLGPEDPRILHVQRHCFVHRSPPSPG